MYKIKTIAIGAVLAIVSGPAIAALPSTDWVNEQLDTKVDVNQGTENAGYFLQVNDDGEVEPYDLDRELENFAEAVVNTKVNISRHDGNMALVTDPDGNVIDGSIINSMIGDEQITVDKVASDAKFRLDNINLPTPPAACDNGTATCMLMYSDGYFAWDVVTRDTNNPTDVMPTAGQVSGANYVNGTRPDVDGAGNRLPA